MPNVHHVNLANEDGQIYCCLRNRVVQLDDKQKLSYCAGCKMYSGDAGGKGVECDWDDVRDIANPHVVTDSRQEWRSNQRRKVKPHMQAFSDYPGVFISVNY